MLFWPQAGLSKELSIGIIEENPLARVGDTPGSALGVIGEAVATLLHQKGFQPRYESLPAARAYKMVESGEIDLAITVLKTAERAYYSAPILTEFTVLVVPKGKGFALRSLADLKGKVIGGRSGFLYPSLDRAEGVVIERNSTSAANYMKLLAGRLDAVLAGSISGGLELRQLGLMDKVEQLPAAVGIIPLGAAFSMQHFSAADVADFDRGIAGLKSTRHWGVILNRYGAEGLVRPWPLVGK